MTKEVIKRDLIANKRFLLQVVLMIKATDDGRDEYDETVIDEKVNKELFYQSAKKILTDFFSQNVGEGECRQYPQDMVGQFFLMNYLFWLDFFTEYPDQLEDFLCGKFIYLDKN